MAYNTPAATRLISPPVATTDWMARRYHWSNGLYHHPPLLLIEMAYTRLFSLPIKWYISPLVAIIDRTAYITTCHYYHRTAYTRSSLLSIEWHISPPVVTTNWIAYTLPITTTDYGFSYITGIYFSWSRTNVPFKGIFSLLFTIFWFLF